jgi:hypothetical protein
MFGTGDAIQTAETEFTYWVAAKRVSGDRCGVITVRPRM